MSRAEVSFRDKEARVTFDLTQVTVEQLIEPFEKLAEGGSDKTARIKAKELLDDARLHADSDEEVEAEDKNEEDEEMEDEEDSEDD